MHLATGNWHTCIYANCQKLACSRSRSKSSCEQQYGCRCMYVLCAAVCIDTYNYVDAYDQVTNYSEKRGYFSNPPKKLCNNFFGVHRTLLWSN